MARPTILDEIIRWKRGEVERCKATAPLEAVQAASAQAPTPRDFAAALRQPGMSLIAEIKRASPSKGLLRPDLEPVALAREYETGCASAISVLISLRKKGQSRCLTVPGLNRKKRSMQLCRINLQH